MKHAKVVSLVVAMLGLLSGRSSALNNGMALCGNGVFHNEATCSPSACTGTLIPTCTAPEGFTSGTVTISFIQGVCDDLGPVTCGDKFRYYFEGCGGTRQTLKNLGNARVLGAFRVCYDPSGAGQCSGAGMEILKGTVRWENWQIAPAPAASQGEHTFTSSKAFTFNGKKHRLTISHGFSVVVGESGACTSPECGFGGCLYKTQ